MIMVNHDNGSQGLRLLNGQQMTCPYQTEVSREIRILSEVEKIWIIFDVDSSGKLDKDEIKDYIKYMAGDRLKLTDRQIDQVYELIDTDNDGSIDKLEMEIFLRAMMLLQEDLTFKLASKYLEVQEKQKVQRQRMPRKSRSPGRKMKV